MPAAHRIKIITDRIVRNLDKKIGSLIKEKYEVLFSVFNRVVAQEKNNCNRIYIIHQLHLKCIAKVKEAKKYEFGNKSAIVKTKESGIIVRAMALLENVYDGDTLLPQVEQTEKITMHKPMIGIVQRG